MRRRWSRNRPGADRVPMPHPLRWTFVFLVLFTASATLFLAGTVFLAHLTAWLRTVRDAHLLDVVSAVLAVTGILAVRRALFARLARKPGPIQITSAGSTITEGGPAVDGILADIRQTLTTISISTPQSFPNAPSSSNILDDVKTAADTTKNVVATAAALLNAILQVRHAYRVSVLVRGPEGARPCGLTVHVTMLPGNHGVIETVWGDDWADVVSQAAHLIGSFILPRSRLAALPPWTSWHGRNMPSELFHHHQQARHHLREREYERAIGAFHRALKIDTQNSYLRIELGQAQEQLGLFMDALATYADVISVESWYDRQLWRRLWGVHKTSMDGTPPKRFGRSPHGRDALLIARYRLVSRLAAADRLADQWQRGLAPTDGGTPRNPIRAVERHALRGRLKGWLAGYAVAYCDQQGLTDPQADVFDAGRTRVRHFLQYVATRESAQLVSDYRWTGGRRRPGMPVSQTALNVLAVWAPLYLDFADAWLHTNGTDERRKKPPTAAELDLKIENVLKKKPARAREWQEYYNAACAVAVALGDWPGNTVDEQSRKELARCAVRYLERAVNCTDSGNVSVYAQWLATGDQDLNPLRTTSEFVVFLDRYLPNDELRVPRPENLLTFIMAMHNIALLHRYAAMRAAWWSRLRRTASQEELEAENRVAGMVRAFALNDRDWRTRLELIEEALSFAHRTNQRTFSSALPQFQADPNIRRYFADSSSRSVNEYYDGIAAKRDGVWQRVLALLPEPSTGNGNGQPVHTTPGAAMAFWRRLADELSAALHSDYGTNSAEASVSQPAVANEPKTNSR